MRTFCIGRALFSPYSFAIFQIDPYHEQLRVCVNYTELCVSVGMVNWDFIIFAAVSILQLHTNGNYRWVPPRSHLPGLGTIGHGSELIVFPRNVQIESICPGPVVRSIVVTRITNSQNPQ